MKALLRAGFLLIALALAGALGFALLDLPPAAVDLPSAVSAQMDRSGVTHPVTAVLLNFRGYDTLLEVAVLLLALFTLLVVGGSEHPVAVAPQADPVVQALARLAIPLILLAGGYLLWAGAHRPGGAFQAGAVLAAGAVLLHLAGVLPAWPSPGRLLRLGLMAGFLVFLGVAAGLLGEGALLRYRPELAGALILLIEAGLTLSLGLILAGLFLFVTGRRA